MQINSIGSVPGPLARAVTGDAVAVTMLKKTLEIEAQNARQLIQALPQPTPDGPSYLGKGVNTFA